MTVVVTSGLICSYGFQIAGVVGWLVGQIGNHWLGLLLIWALDCKVFSGSGFVDVVVDDLIRWW